MARRSLWSGAISFGLVNVPCKLYSATSPKDVKFNQLNSETGARIKQKRVDADTGDEVPFENIIKGYEISSGRYVTITADELDEVAPDKTKQLTLDEFVLGEEISPLLYDKSYWVAPDGPASEKPYRLLKDAMAQSGKVGVGRVVLRSKEKLVALRVEGDALLCSTMVFSDELLSPGLELTGNGAANEAEMKMAQLLIDSLTTEFDHTAYEDSFRAQVMEMINAKAGGEVYEAPKVEKPTETPDLMAALTASLEAGPKKSKPKKAPTKAPKKVAA